MVSYYTTSPQTRQVADEDIQVTPISYYARETRRRNRVLRDDLRRAEPDGILNLVAQRGHSWDSIATSTALHALACKMKGSTSTWDLKDARWQRLCALTFQHLVEGEARNLANVAWSLASLRCKLFPFQDLAKQVVLHAEELKPQEVSNLMWSLAHLRFHHVPMISSLVSEVVKQVSGFSCQDASNTMWALASLAVAEDRALETLLPSAMRNIYQFKPQECANTIWALAILALSDVELVEKIAEHAVDIVTEFRNQNLSNFIWAFAKLGHKDEVTTAKLLQVSLGRLSTFSPQDLTTTIWALATMDYRQDDFVASTLRELQQRAGVISLQPQHVSNTFWALATLRGSDEPAIEFLCASMCSRITEFKPQELANFIWSMAITGERGEPALVCIVGQVEMTLHEFSCQSTANFVWSYAKLGLNEPHVLCLVKEAAAPKLNTFSEQDLSTTLWAFSTMLHRDDVFLDHWMCAISQKLLEKPVKPQHASNILWALASIAFYDGPFFTTLTDGIRKSIKGFAAQDIACCTWACATVVHRDQSFTDLMASEAADKLKYFDPQSVGNTVWGATYLKTSVSKLYHSLSDLMDATTLSCYNDKVVAMVARALMTGFAAEMSWDVFHRLQQLDQNPGISALSLWLHHCRHVQPCIGREMQVMSVLARFQPCRYVQQAILNVAALRLAEDGFLTDALSLVQELLHHDATNIIAGHLHQQLFDGFYGAEAVIEPLQMKWKLPSHMRGHSGTDYDKQCRLLEHVLSTAQKGDAWSVVTTIERFSVDGNGWLKIAGGGKGMVLDDLVRKLSPQPPSLVLEFGLFVGYSSTRMAYWLRGHGGKVLSVEVDPIHVAIARNVIEFAGVANHVSICLGYSEDVIPHLKETCCGASADAVFFDQRGTRFHTDLCMLESEELMKDGCAVLADNVLKPGAPHFLWYLQHSPHYDLTVVSLREFAADRIEDWMALGIYHPGNSGPAVFFPKSLDRLAFLTDKARAHSCNADGPCEVDEDAWARHAQEIRRAYDDVQINPHIVRIIKSSEGEPFVDWETASFGSENAGFVIRG
ncbi:Catechol O-methyltransferase [Durusdinium trenchii]|uniref:Catechol O-methyltransferase n=1 Tax=Durusdinium trenchii TaxID=1381693 RepID=A0ABP0RFT3_9DINO